MESDILVALIGIVPSVLWTLFAAVLVAAFYRPLKWQLLPRLTSFNVFGIEGSFAEEEMEQAIAGRGVSVSEDERAAVLRRLRRAASVTQGAAVLWVDSAPADTVHERALLRHAGISIELCRSAEDAAGYLSAGGPDVVIARLPEGGPAAVMAGLAKGQRCGKGPYLIVYSPEAAGAELPPDAFAAAERPDQLVHSLVDALERGRC